MRKPEKPGVQAMEYSGILVQILRDLAAKSPTKTCALERDIACVKERSANEGIGFLTKSLPTLGKCLDKALARGTPLEVNAPFSLLNGTRYPEFLGQYFNRVFTADGYVREIREDLSDLEGLNVVHLAMSARGLRRLQAEAVRAIRQVCYLFYKLELEYEPEVVTKVLDKFVSTDESLPEVGSKVSLSAEGRRALENARMILWYVLKDFDPLDIVPRHGPGAVATGEQPWEKMNFSRYYAKLDEVYSYSEYFFYNYTHLCDELSSLVWQFESELPTAKVVLVPKDSRGPRLISMEPLELQWIQQGLASKLMQHIEHERSKASGYVNFTDQTVNRNLAWSNSEDGRMVTIDLEDASDRVSDWLVSEIFPKHVYDALVACRSDDTVLPTGLRVGLRKFAPMGSACCFPVEALCFWALSVGTLKTVTRKADMEVLPSVYVYGDDIILPREALDAVRSVFVELHLKLSESKCCVGRFFRESCGMDAFRMEDVTPIRIKHVIANLSSPPVALAYVSYANNLRVRGYGLTADFVESLITEKWPLVPVTNRIGSLSFAFLRPDWDATQVGEYNARFPKRYNKRYQDVEYKIPIPVPRYISRGEPTWAELLRLYPMIGVRTKGPACLPGLEGELVSVGPYRHAVPRRIQMRGKWTSVSQLAI